MNFEKFIVFYTLLFPFIDIVMTLLLFQPLVHFLILIEYLNCILFQAVIHQFPWSLLSVKDLSWVTDACFMN